MDIKKYGRMKYLVETLNEYRNLYYNHNDSPVTDEVYDRLFDELAKLEKETGVVLGNSPTNTVGFEPINKLESVHHPIALLSLDKTKSVDDVIRFIGNNECILMYKLDGLTVRLDYEDGELVLAATRGDGAEGDNITHNIPAFVNVPTMIPYKDRLSVSGEAFIYRHDFDRINKALPDDEKFKNARNMASGSVRAYDPKICQMRAVHFNAFKVMEGLDEITSKIDRLDKICEFGFDICPMCRIENGTEAKQLEHIMSLHKDAAHTTGIPVDGMVIQYDDIEYSKSCGATGHHYKDGIAFKFEDELYETILRNIEWKTTRSGYMAPTAIYDTVEIDGCAMSRATLHNVSQIRKLDLHIGDRILISKRNMIIPAIEANLDAGKGNVDIPSRCLQCGAPAEIRFSTVNGRKVEKLYCTNEHCGSANVRQFVHFADKDSVNIEGLAEGTIEKLVEAGFLNEIPDLYELSKYKNEIIAMEGFGEKSYEKLIASIEASKKLPFYRFLRAMDIPLVGRHASKTISSHFDDNIAGFEKAIYGEIPFDFTTLGGIGDILNQNIYEWFDNEENVAMWDKLKLMMIFEHDFLTKQPASGVLSGKTVVVTGKVEGYTRSEMDNLISELGGTAGDSVTKNTDMLVIAEKPGGSKVKKAEALGTKTMTIDEFMKMVGR